MQSSSLALKDRTRQHLGPEVAVALLFAVMCGVANAQTTATATIFVVAAGNPLPVGSDGACTQQKGFLICVTPDPFDTMAVDVGTDVTIEWKVDDTTSAAGWSFQKNRGIVIQNKKNWSNPKEIPGPPVTYTANNKKEDGAQLYKYNINVKNQNGTDLHWDPTIRN